ncbi:MAG TPA: CpsD/CapB family tyrosine-protein kinase, partial [Dongiaceae bacterium]|nr:CpsD/CapB family tyrosine-protein kinase [Dongiaceae bacterium]
SPGAGEGKTTTAINLAGTLAQSKGSRVLLVDADLRLPDVAIRLGLRAAGQPGLTDAILDARLPLEAVVCDRPPFNLSVLTSGRHLDAPYEALRSPRFGALLDQARRTYDYVIVDSPPVLPVPDTRVIARWADSLLLVVAAHRTPRRYLEEALNALDPEKVAGLVFNSVDPPPLGPYAYYRGYGAPPAR